METYMWFCKGLCLHVSVHLILCKHVYACLVCVIITASTMACLYLEWPIHDIHTSLILHPLLPTSNGLDVGWTQVWCCKRIQRRNSSNVIYVTQQSLLTCYVMLQYIILCHVMLQYVKSCHVMLRYDMYISCYVISYHFTVFLC